MTTNDLAQNTAASSGPLRNGWAKPAVMDPESQWIGAPEGTAPNPPSHPHPPISEAMIRSRANVLSQSINPIDRAEGETLIASLEMHPLDADGRDVCLAALAKQAIPTYRSYQSCRASVQIDSGAIRRRFATRLRIRRAERGDGRWSVRVILAASTRVRDSIPCSPASTTNNLSILRSADRHE